MALDPAGYIVASFGGAIGDRLLANRRNWLRVAPVANPAMVTMFDHTRTNPRPGGGYLSWSGEFAGKWLLSAIEDLRLSHDFELHRTVEGVANRLVQLQAANGGYLGTFSGTDRIFGQNWDAWNHYHCLRGLLAWAQHVGGAAVTAACRQIADHLIGVLGGGSEIGRLVEPAKNFALAHAFALLHRHTAEPRYLAMVRAFEQGWDTVAGGGRYVSGFQQPATLFGVTGLDARWERLHSFQAVAELARITGDSKYLVAVQNAWNAMRAVDRHSTGGFSSSEVASGNPFDPRPIETCGTVAWMALTVDVLRLTGWSIAADELELSLWNAVLGAQAPDGSWWTYNTPMGGIDVAGMGNLGFPHPVHRPPTLHGERRPARYDLGWQGRGGAEYLSCCAANAPRGLGLLADWAVMSSDDGVVVNYYGPCSLRVLDRTGAVVAIDQSTAYPTSGRVVVRVTASDDSVRTVALRIPEWARSSTVRVDGGALAQAAPGSYHEVSRSWAATAIIELDFALSTRAVDGGPRPAGADPASGNGAVGLTAYYFGPLLLAYDEREQAHRVETVPRLRTTPQPFATDPRPQPGFPLVRARAESALGDVVLRDFASAGMPAMRVTGSPDVGGRAFQFGRASQQYGPGAAVLAERLRLRPDGTIDGYAHANEARWSWEGPTLVFLDQQNAVTTRFVWISHEHGRLVLRGRPTFDADILHELREVALDPAERLFELSRVGGPVLAPRLRLRSSGVIEGSTHANEHLWERQGDDLLLFSRGGQLTTRFTRTRVAFGLVDYFGAFLPDPTITHRLREIDDAVDDKEWQFRRPLPNVWISIRLRPDGTVEGDHPNESHWQRDGTDLLLLDPNRAVTTKFTTLTKLDDGRLVWRGSFLPNQAITHELVEWNVDLEWARPVRYRSWFSIDRLHNLGLRIPWTP